jgi:hypothetical protein
MKTRFLILLTAVVMLLVLGVTGCTTSTPQPTPTQPPPSIPTPQPTTTLKPNAAIVLGTAERHNAGDMEGMMEYWSDDAMWSLFGYPPTGTEIYTGKEQVQELFEENIANHAQWEVEIDAVVGDVVYAHSKNWHDFTRQIGVAPLEHSLVYEIKDGKIVKLSAYLTEDSTIRLKTALAEAMPAEQETESEEEAPVEQPVSELTVTFSGGTCSYDGPLALQAGEIQVTVDVQDQDKNAYAVLFFRLDPGKDFMDLMAASLESDPPSWSKMKNFSEVMPGESETYSISVTEGLLYGMCLSKPPDLAIGGLGPFSVSPVPATATPLPTKEPTATPTSRPPLGPEQPALSIEQVAGRWLMKIMGGGEGDPAIFTLAEDGTHRIDAIGGYHAGMNVGTGTYWFDEDIMSLYSEDCTSPSTMFFTCTGTYRVFVAMAEDGPGALRLVAIEDPHPDRKISLNNKTLYPAPPAEE